MINPNSLFGAFCSNFTYENREMLKRFIPPGYPRMKKKSSTEKTPIPAITIGALAFSVFVLLLVLLIVMLVYYYRKEKVIVYAQPTFLYLVLTGAVLMLIGAIFFALLPGNATCASRHWFTVLGLTLELVPVIVKVNAVNTIFRTANKMKRVTIKRSKLYMNIGVILFFIVVYLICWTAIGNLAAITESWSLDEEGDRNSRGGYFVDIEISCSDRTTGLAWYIVIDCFFLFLMAVAMVLAYQTRKVRQEFNESSRLAFIIYSHFIFHFLRMMLAYAELNLAALVAGALLSYMYTADTLMMLFIYFLPKLYDAKWPLKKDQEYISPFARMSFQFSTAIKKIGSGRKMRASHEAIKKIGSGSKMRASHEAGKRSLGPGPRNEVTFAKNLESSHQICEESLSAFDTRESHIADLKDRIAESREKLAAMEKELHIAETKTLNGYHQQATSFNGIWSSQKTAYVSRKTLETEKDENVIDRSPEDEHYHESLRQIELQESRSLMHSGLQDETVKLPETINTSGESVSSSLLVEEVSLEFLETGTNLSTSGDSSPKWNDDDTSQQPCKPSRRHSGH